jgi:glycosyltransferase involved in cell wall biosynthesis
MKKILIFSVAYVPFVGGAEVAVDQITKRISDIEFDMITLNLDGRQPAKEKMGPIMVYRIGGPGKLSKLFFPFTSWFLATRLNRHRKYDAVWSIMASFSGFAARIFLFGKKTPFLLTLQEGDPLDEIQHKVRHVSSLFKSIFTRATRIQVISNFLKKFALDMGATAPIVVIPNGVPLTLFSAPMSDEMRRNLRGEWGLHDHDTVLVTTSRLVKKNGVGDIIRALPLMPQHIKLIVVGVGPLEQELKNLVAGFEVEDRVQFAGYVHYEHIPKYLYASDIFIRPSLSEGMGNSFIEAMATGLPIIATPVGGIPDFLHDGETGIMCEPENPQSIADAVERLVADKKLRHHIQQNAAELVKTYDWNSIAERMEKEFFADEDFTGEDQG